MRDNFPGGYTGNILRVNLSDEVVSTERLDGRFLRKYLGGAGLLAYYLYTELKPGVDALAPDNKLIFSLGPLTGVHVPGNDRTCIGSKSPLTGRIAKSEVGGYWGVELKRAGFDGIIIEGRARRPVYIWIQDTKVEIKGARHLWGKETKETLSALREELGDNRIRVAMIGPAGERMVRYACIMNGLYDAAGRGGTGAVMGSKNLKAIAVRGHGKPKVASPELVKELREWLMDNKQLWGFFNEGFGTGGMGIAMEADVVSGNLSVNNFRDGVFPDARLIDCSEFRVGMEGCWACPLRCKKVMKFEERYCIDQAYGGPEYESLGSLGTNCGISDIYAISKANERCNALGLDVISTGVTISFAMECYENGLLTKKDTGGVELKFGNSVAMLEMVDRIAKREGIGELLAEGVQRAAQAIGRDAQRYAMHIKGQEIPMHEPRLKRALGIGYMVQPYGADHVCNMVDQLYAMEGWRVKMYEPFGFFGPFAMDDASPLKVAMLRNVQLQQLSLDCLLLCKYVPYDMHQVADLVGAVAGWNTSAVEHIRVGERVLTLSRLFNMREGFTEKDDELPERFYEPKTGGVLADRPLDRNAMRSAKKYYYRLMGWSPSGVPLQEKIDELEIP